MMQTIKLNDIDQLLRAFNELENHFIFRGHSDATWELESSLERVVGEKYDAEAITRLEDFSLICFKSKYHLYSKENNDPSSKLEWLSLLQHYGVPTRLIDFTESPYAALYFALESYNTKTKPDLAVIALDYRAIMQESIKFLRGRKPDFTDSNNSMYGRQDMIYDKYIDGSNFNIAWISEPQRLNPRIDRQAGTFLISGSRDMQIKNVLNEAIYRDVKSIKYVLSGSMYEGIYSLLNKMNINGKSIYGDIDGLARSIRMELLMRYQPLS